MIIFLCNIVFYFTWDKHFYNVCPFVFGSWCWLVSVFPVPILYFNAGIYVVTLSADCFVPCLLVSLFVTKSLTLIFAYKTTEKNCCFLFSYTNTLLTAFCALLCLFCGWFVCWLVRVLVGSWCWLVRGAGWFVVLVGSCFLSKVSKS